MLCFSEDEQPLNPKIQPPPELSYSENLILMNGKAMV